MHLDRSRQYDTVAGISGASFMQDGVLFNAGGEPVTMHTRELTGRDDDGKEWKRDEHYVTLGADVPERVEAKPASDGSYATMSLRELRALCSQYGHTYIDKESAIAFLEAQE